MMSAFRVLNQLIIVEKRLIQIPLRTLAPETETKVSRVNLQFPAAVHGFRDLLRADEVKHLLV